MRIRKEWYPPAEEWKNKSKKRKGSWIGVITLINALFLLVGILCWTGTYLRNEALNECVQGYAYEVCGDTVDLDLGDDVRVELRFGENSVQIKDAYRVTTIKDQTQVILFIRQYLSKQNQPLTRTVTDCVGEYRLHYRLYRWGYEEERTKDVDLEYEGDSRWYVNVCSRVIGFVGW